MGTEAQATTIETGGHVVFFYEEDADLIATLGAYVAAAIRAGDATLIIATREHREELAYHLDAAGVDVVEARRTETFVTLDAADTLARFYAHGQIDVAEFRSVIGGAIRDVARRTGRAVRCHGEMVALLWEAGTVAAGLELEELWNDLGGEVDFSLLCSYRSQSVAGSDRAEDRRSVHQLHSRAFDSQQHLPLEVHQATGMVAAQLGISTALAVQRLRDYAADRGEALDPIARAVVSRRLRLSDPGAE